MSTEYTVIQTLLYFLDSQPNLRYLVSPRFEHYTPYLLETNNQSEV